MIKKINKLIDDMPFIIKLILGIIMTGIITLCFFIIGVVQVNAASIDYNNTGQYIHKTFPTDEWITLQRGTDYTLTSSYVYNQVNIQWQNYQPGVANGVAQFDITSGTLATYTCSDIMQMIRVVENGTDTGATLRNMGCIIGNNRVRLQVGFVTSVIGTNSYLEVQLRQSFTVATNINVLGVMTVNSIDPATNTDIQDQTNALTQVINDIKNNIINQMKDNLNLCQLKTYDKNNTTGVLGYLNANGTTGVSTVSKISDYIKIEKNQTYQLVYGDRWGNSSYCLYDENKTLLNCVAYNLQTTININNTTGTYIKYTYNFTSDNYFFTGKICQDRTQAEIDELQQLRNQLMHSGEWEEEDDEVKNGLLRNIISGIGNIFGFLGDDELDDPDDALSDLSSNMGTNNVISSLLLLPVSIYQSVVNNINGTCNSFNLGSLYNHNLTMTCIRPQDYLGSALWGFIDVIISGIFVLHIRKKFVDIFNHFTSLRTGGNELE